jgi:outer membrane protein
LIKESAFGNFLPSVNASHSWNIGLNQDTTGLLQNQTTQFTSAGVNVELIFIKIAKSKYVAQSESLYSCSKISIVKMQEDVADVTKCFLASAFLTRKI